MTTPRKKGAGARRQTKPERRVTLTLTPFESHWLQDRVDDEGLPPDPSAASKVERLQRRLHAITGETRPTARPVVHQAESPIHTPLTLDDRDALDLLRHRIAWQAILVQRIITTWDSEDDEIDDADRPILESGLLELCRSIVEATGEMRELCDVAEKRQSRGEGQ